MNFAFMDVVIRVYKEQGWQSESGIRQFFINYQESGIRNFRAGFGFQFFSQHKYLNFKIFISCKNVCKISKKIVF